MVLAQFNRGLPHNPDTGGLDALKRLVGPTRPLTRRSTMQISVRTAPRLSVWAGVLALAAATAQAQTPAPNPHLARNLAATCANCHGTNGNALGEMKSLAGTSAERTIALMTFYKTTPQPEGVTIMHQIAKGYTDDQIKLIAGYFAAQQPKK
jgi:cytochrome c553